MYQYIVQFKIFCILIKIILQYTSMYKITVAGYKLDTPPPSIKVEIDSINETCTQRKPASLPVQTQWDTSKPSKGPL